jgi:hypothetical protein
MGFDLAFQVSAQQPVEHNVTRKLLRKNMEEDLLFEFIFSIV